jgi:DNA-binding MarR family transcriptional regulator
VDRLCDQGQIERRPHPRDRRANRLYLTDKGRETLVRLAPLGREVAADILRSLDEAELVELLQKLLRIKANIRGAASRRIATNAAHGARHAR